MDLSVHLLYLINACKILAGISGCLTPFVFIVKTES